MVEYSSSTLLYSVTDCLCGAPWLPIQMAVSNWLIGEGEGPVLVWELENENTVGSEFWPVSSRTIAWNSEALLAWTIKGLEIYLIFMGFFFASRGFWLIRGCFVTFFICAETEIRKRYKGGLVSCFNYNVPLPRYIYNILL